MTNLVILVGRIARDPETRTTQGGTKITQVTDQLRWAKHWQFSMQPNIPAKKLFSCCC